MKNSNLLSNTWAFILGLIIFAGGILFLPNNIITFYLGILLMIFAAFGAIKNRIKRGKQNMPPQ